MSENDESEYDGAAEAWRLRQELKNIELWYERYRRDFMPPVSKEENDVVGKPVEVPPSSLRDFKLVGRFSGYYGCLQHEKHGLTTLEHLEGKKGIVYVRKHLNSCDRPSCPTCYRFGWAVREGAMIEGRLAEASKRFGLVEHIICSAPEKDYNLTYKELKDKTKIILFSCGITGGVMIFHGHRYNEREFWYFNPHMHVLGFVLGGYERCRRCKGADCYACDGVEGKCYRAYHDSGYIVRVLDERKTVGGTAWYQLHHSSIDMSKKRFRVTTWFGSCGYRNLKVKVARRKALCPLCHDPLGPIEYVGSKSFVLSRNSPDFKRESYEEYEENGSPAWIVRESKPYGR